MDSNVINFSKDLELDVDVSLGDLPITKGRLILKCNRSPYLSVDDFSWIHLLHKKQWVGDKRNAVVKCLYKNDTYYLYSNDIHHGFLYPKYIVRSEHQYVYSKIYMSISGVFRFFNGVRGFILKDGELRKRIEEYFLDVDFDCFGKEYSLKIYHDFYLSNESNETHFFEDAVICVENKKGYISFDEAKSLAFKVHNFFSLVFGVGLSIKYVSLGGSSNSKVIYSPFYFLNHYNDSDVITYPAKTLITDPSYLTNEDWQKMLNSFFSERNRYEFEKIWTRLVSMKNYKVFLEYEILGYASILDVYSQNIVKKIKTSKIPSDKFNKLKDKVISLIEETSAELGINAQDSGGEVVKSFYTYIKEFRNTINPNFSERYKYALKHIDHDFLEIINFTDENFNVLKKIRNDAAHGMPIRLENEKGDSGLKVNEVFILLNKLVMILSCLSFKTLGIDEKRFANLIINSNNDTKVNALLDRMKLDLYCKEAKVVYVDFDTFTKARDLFSFDFVIQENQAEKQLTFNNSSLLSMMERFKLERNGLFVLDEFCSFVYTNYISRSIYCVEVINKVYCVYNDKKLCLHNVLWITYQSDYIDV